MTIWNELMSVMLYFLPDSELCVLISDVPHVLQDMYPRRKQHILKQTNHWVWIIFKGLLFMKYSLQFVTGKNCSHLCANVLYMVYYCFCVKHSL